MDKFNCPIVFTHEAISSRSPATRKVIRHVSFGKYNLSLEPLATNWKNNRKANQIFIYSSELILIFASTFKLKMLLLTSTIAEDLPARCKNGRNCFAFVGS